VPNTSSLRRTSDSIRRNSKGSLIDRWLAGGTRLSAFAAASVLLLVAAFVAREAGGALFEPGLGHFFGDARWLPTAGEFGVLPLLLGSALTTIGAVLIGAPLGIANAVFGRFYAPRRIQWVHRRLIELLAGIPSVVYGLWGLVVLVPLVSQWGGSGQSLLTATVILALMILPTVALTSDAALAAVPREHLDGAVALGLGRWSTLWRVALPGARRGIATGIVLATGRAVGETMAVLMVAGNVVQVPSSVLDPVRTLTANIALEMSYATSGHRAALFATGLLLMAVVSTLLALLAQRRGSVRPASAEASRGAHRG
jgi:phosphate transport system permease protein